MDGDLSQTRIPLERRRTAFDVLLGVLAVIVGFVVLGHTAVASLVSVLFLGWMALIGGLVVAVGAALAWRQAGHWSDLLAGIVLMVLGFGFVRHPGASLLVLIVDGVTLAIGGRYRPTVSDVRAPTPA